MPMSILATKLYIPPYRRDLVSRSILVDRLQQGSALGPDDKTGQGTQQILGSAGLDSEEAKASMVNDIAKASGKLILVLDDYHVIESSEVDDVVSFLLEHSRKQLHLVITTRTDSALPFARMRANGELTEVRAADLQFTVNEATEFLNRTMGLGLSPANILSIEGRTEEWIAGLSLAALSPRGNEDAARLV
jgi:LuxR family transcriptional regulator, maltose regulon positive regulatory protein